MIHTTPQSTHTTTQNIIQPFEAVARKTFKLADHQAISYHATLKDDFGANSLTIISFHIALEAVFNVKLRGVQPERLNTLNDWLYMLEDCLLRHPAEDTAQNEPAFSHVEDIRYLSGTELDKLSSAGTWHKRWFRRLLQFVLGICAALAPAICRKIVVFLYRTPGKMPVAEWEARVLERATKKHICINDNQVCYYQWGQGTPVLLCHGWSGHAGQLGQFVEPLSDAGFSVISIEAPGHGNSVSKQADIHMYADAVSALMAAYPFYAAIGHCFGATTLVSTLATNNCRLERLVLISAFENLNWLADLYSKTLNIPADIVGQAFDDVDNIYGKDNFCRHFSCQRMLATQNMKTLAVHDEDDDFVFFRHAAYIAQSPNVSLFKTNGLAHRFILIHPPTIDKIVSFLQ